MATWVRSLTGTAPSATNADVTSPNPVSLTNATAPGDFNPANVTSVRFQVTFAVTGGSFPSSGSDSYFTYHLYEYGSPSLANVDGANATLTFGTNTTSIDLTDSSPGLTGSVADWQTGVYFGGTEWMAFTQVKGGDGVTVSMTVCTITITYTPDTGQSISPALKQQLVTTQAPTITGGATIVTVTTAAGSDDGHIDGTAFFNTSSYMWVGKAGGNLEHMFFRFPNVTVPSYGNSVVIDSAILTLGFVTHDLTDPPAGNAVGSVKAEDEDNPVAYDSYSGGSQPWAFRTPTTATVSWTLLNNWTDGTNQDTPDLKTIIQELVDRTGWVSGNAMLLYWEATSVSGSDDEWQMASHETWVNELGPRPTLVITYHLDSGLDITPVVKTQLATAINPTLTPGSVNMSPGLKQQLAQTIDPTLQSTAYIVPTFFAQQFRSDFPPTLTSTYNMSPALLQQLALPIDPTVAPGPVNMSPDLYQQLALAFDPEVAAGTTNISPALYQQLATTFAATVYQQQFLSPSISQQLASYFNPTVVPGAVNISPNLVFLVPFVHAPTLTPGSVSISAELVQQLAAAIDPSVAGGPVNIDPALIQQIASALDPVVAVGPINITADIATQLASALNPTLTTHAYVSPETMDSTAVAFDPTVSSIYYVLPQLLSQAISTFNPTFQLGAANISPGLTYQLTSAFSDHIISSGEAFIAPTLADQSVTVFDPTLDWVAWIIPSLVQQITSANDPSVSPGVVTISPDLLSNLLSAFEASLFSEVWITPNLETNIAVAYDPTVDAPIAGQEITVILLQQQVTATDPVVAAGTVYIIPGLTPTLIVAFGPDLGGEGQDGQLSLMTDWSD